MVYDPAEGGKPRVPEGRRLPAWGFVIEAEGATLESIKSELRELTGDSLERRVATSLAPALGVRADAVAQSDGDQPLSWRRVPVAEGIEIHVRDDSPAARDEAVVAMREAVRAALGREELR